MRRAAAAKSSKRRGGDGAGKHQQHVEVPGVAERAFAGGRGVERARRRRPGRAAASRSVSPPSASIATTLRTSPYRPKLAASASAIHSDPPPSNASTSTPIAAIAMAIGLHAPQPLAQYRDAERDIDQRIDEIAEARLEHMIVLDRPDIDRSS
jgi:hypothetical protein